MLPNTDQNLTTGGDSAADEFGTLAVTPKFLDASIAISAPTGGILGSTTVAVSGMANCLLHVQLTNGEPDILDGMPYVTKVEVRFNSGAYQLATPTGTNGSWSSWTFSGNVGTATSVLIEARVTADHPVAVDDVATASVSVQVDSSGPALTIVPIPDVTALPYTIPISGTVSDTPAGVKRVEYRIGSNAVTTATRSGSNWSGTITLPGIGSHTLTVRALDNLNNTTEKTATIVVKDIKGPDLTITAPPEGSSVNWDGVGAPVTLTGTASDAQSTIQAVEWKLASQTQFTLATPAAPGNWSTWSAAIVLPAAGSHTIIVRARDSRNNLSEQTRTLVAVIPFEPRDPLDVVSAASYLDDLLGFAELRVRRSAGNISRALLATTFHQPFDGLTEPSRRAVANQLVQQVRICIEVLRAYLASRNGTLPAAAQASYVRAAYTTLLRTLGSSYEELRLARVADAATRAALAERLGFALTTPRPDELDRLTLPLDQLTEHDLELLFGLIDTTRNPLDTANLDEPQLLTSGRAYLRTRWRQQDETLRAGPLGPQAIIDPDLIGLADLRLANPAAPAGLAYQLWQARRLALDTLLASIKAQREAAPSPAAGFDAIVSSFVAPVATLTALHQQHQQGTAILAQLHTLQLELQPFLYLMRFRQLVAGTSVLAEEWADIYAILVQVQKLRQQATWRDQERAQNLTLSPDFFVLAADSAAPMLPAWRATLQVRQSWQQTLAARSEQDQLLRQALLTAVAETEAATLPLLRDALVAAIAPGVPLADAANRLTQELAIDVQSSGRQPISRVAQAIETLQGVLFGLRTQRLATSPSSPAAGWSLTISSTYGEADFDEEWRWMGVYATWRSAMFVFGYPENYLLPTLRPEADRTGAFNDLIVAVRDQTRLTPAQARKLANEVYLIKLSQELGTALPPDLRPDKFTITEELTETQLQARQTLIAGLFGTVTEPHLAPRYVREMFYFVPMLLALQLQRAGQYLAALDWVQTVYAYNRPLAQRNIYYGLTLEQQIDTEFHRAPTWLLDGLNPHEIVHVRANAYTRFTLMSLVRCFLEFADAEFTQDTGESIPRARALYVTALDLLDLPEMQPDADNPFPPNPVIQSLRLHADMNLRKLRSGRNIAGIERQADLDAAQPGSFAGLTGAGDGALLPRPGTLRPTPYRYVVLIERAKQLVTIAQQLEAAFLATLEKRDAEAYNLLKARQDTQLARAGVRLQELRLTEARDNVDLARIQLDRVNFQADYYRDLLDEGLIELEQAALGFMGAAAYLQLSAGLLYGVGAIADTARAVVSFGLLGDPTGQAAAAMTSLAAASSTTASILQTMASYERRRDEWRFQHGLALHEVRGSLQQITIAQDQVRVVDQERRIALTQANNAEETLDFLANKFTNAELYEWMSGILGRVYSYFLQQATAVAQLAQSQLAFERQETPPAYIQADYWQTPAEGGDGGTAQPDRRGLTGSARLLQDIYQLDQFAFETNKRKLQLSQTISLAQLAPAEFQRFRETGRLTFSTPLDLFDRAFPGHYLRLIRRVRTSIIALIPPAQGVRATLSSSGISRVVIGGDLFQPITVRRDPELVALTSPVNATGLFELEPEGDLLLPFEGLGVETTWQLLLPKAANPFDFSTIADVLITIEYTALHSPAYRQQVIQRLDRNVSADRLFSLRQQFADQWFDLHNPDQSATPLRVRFSTSRADFPPNLEELRMQQVLLYVVRADGQTFELPVTLQFTPDGSNLALGGAATTVDGTISTRRSNGVAWLPITDNQAPVGSWELALPDTAELRARLAAEQISDLLLVVTYRGRTPQWP